MDRLLPGMRRWHFIAFLALLGLVVLCAITVLAPREPLYHGKPLSAWVGNSGALNEIGPKALPFILRRLERDHSNWRSQYQKMWPRLPQLLQKFLPKPKEPLDEISAGNSFLAVGPGSIPLAIRSLKDKNPLIRQAAAIGLEVLCRNNLERAKLGQAVPDLVECMGDPGS